ncbi:nucleophile aminohydrolase [Calycina marina]|uniref:Nucleophile aminohydrolase n=1 Tax=Calycina marina TaxID=1763456 RepID=A0A9P7Z1B1_9HELO|nr:nucleophile aminohydrolase [Calycina marina]
MCRFLVYKGSDEILLSKLILDPAHSILTQSFDSRLRLDRRRPHNGDGFGIGYYTDPKLGPEPCIFTSTTPAWNCINLQRIASKTASPLIFAHVRATTEGSLSDDNCHPFCHGSLMWMHNGGLGAWKYIKRRLAMRLAEKWYLGVSGGTDSEWAFALFLDTLELMGHNPSAPPAAGFGHKVLRQAMLKTIEQINAFIKEIPASTLEEDVDTRSLLNFAIADGHSVVCTRYVSSKTEEAASLFYSSGSSWEDKSRNGQYQMDRKDKGADIVLVASEPLTFERQSWVTVPTNSILTIHKQTVMVHPIEDEYYSYNPYHSRSSNLVRDRGLTGDEKTRLTLTPENTLPSITQRSLQDSVATTLTPSMHLSPALNLSPDSNIQTVMLEKNFRHVSSLADVTNAPNKPQELGNTKKKRRSLTVRDNAMPESESRSPLLLDPTASPEPAQPGHAEYMPDEFRRQYGTDMKIRQYFPELDYRS